MRNVTFYDLSLGDNVKIRQEFGDGRYQWHEGYVSHLEDEYVRLNDGPLINTHIYVGMPNCYIYVLDDSDFLSDDYEYEEEELDALTERSQVNSEADRPGSWMRES